MGFDLGFGSAVNALADFAGAEYFRDKQSDEASFARDWSADQAGVQRAWQERMRSTQYQTTVSDLKAAGLNPMLAVGGAGAGVPGGAMPQASSAQGVAAPQFSESALRAQLASVSAAEVRVKDSQAANIDADTALKKAQTSTELERPEQVRQQVALWRQQASQSVAQIEALMAQAQHSTASASLAAQQADNLRATLPHIRASIEQLNTLAEVNRQQANMIGAQIGKTYAEVQEIQQRVKANLPELNRALAELDQYAKQLDLPRREQDAAAHDRFIGALGAVARVLNPFLSFVR